MLREKRNIELYRMSKVLYQIWDWWRLQGNPARHNDAPKLKKTKKKQKTKKKTKKQKNKKQKKNKIKNKKQKNKTKQKK